MALFNHEAALRYFPALGDYRSAGTTVYWSVHARLLPYCEQTALHRVIDFSIPIAQQPAVAKIRIPYLLCPSEVNDRHRPDGPTFIHYPLTYAFNAGLWKIHQPTTATGAGSGVFLVNQNTRARDLLDGSSNTLGIAEVKAFTPYLRDGGQPSGDIPAPTSPESLGSFGGEFKTDSGHTEWVDARTHQTGFTTTFGPNTFCRHVHQGKEYDIDFNSMREGRSATVPTYAVVTSRSYHSGMVTVWMMDGSTRSVSNSIEISVWQALGTRHGGEIGFFDD